MWKNIEKSGKVKEFPFDSGSAQARIIFHHQKNPYVAHNAQT